MKIPKISELYDPILLFLAEYGENELSEIRSKLAEIFYIPENEATDRKDKRYSLFEGRVNNACFNLYHAGLIDRTYRGRYRLSEFGERTVDRGDYVDADYLWEIPSYKEYILSRRGEADLKPKNHKPAEDKEKETLTKTVRQPSEYVQMETVSIKQIAKLIKQDTRFANMIATGAFLYEDGRIKDVPQEVQMRDVSYQEYKAQNLMHGAGNSAILCYQEANGSGKMISAPPKSISGYHRNPKGPDKWMNPLPWVTSSGANIYPIVKDMLDYIRKNRDFNKCFEHLIKDVYKIKEATLSKKSGVHEKKIQRMMNNPSVNCKITELIAIFWVLKVPSDIVRAMLDLAGISSNSPKNERYMIICTLTVHSTYKEVNDLCRQENLTEIFPKLLENQIP